MTDPNLNPEVEGDRVVSLTRGSYAFDQFQALLKDVFNTTISANDGITYTKRDMFLCHVSALTGLISVQVTLAGMIRQGAMTSEMYTALMGRLRDELIHYISEALKSESDHLTGPPAGNG